MCGLIGVAGNVGVNMEKVFKRLLELDTTRGPHSTGVLSVKNTGETVLAKSLGTPWDLAETKGFNACFTGVVKVLLGHNRWATKGKISKNNAHPFEFDTLVGAHNGTLRSVDKLDNYKDFDVDSENLYYDMNNNGVYETIPKLNGAFALTWYDKVDNTVNFIRNDERDLYFTYTEDMKTLLWASEKWMLHVATGTNGIKIKDPQLLPVGVLHTFDVPQKYDETINHVHTRKLELYTHKPPATFPKDTRVVELRPKKEEVTINKATFSDVIMYQDREVVFSVASKEVNAYGQAYIQGWLEENSNIPVRIFAPEAGELWVKLMSSPNMFRVFIKTYGIDVGGKYLVADLRTVVEVEAEDDVPKLSFIGFEGEEIDKKEFEARTCKGCAWCAGGVDEEDAEELVWFAKSDFICGDCAEQPEVQKYLAK